MDGWSNTRAPLLCAGLFAVAIACAAPDANTAVEPERPPPAPYLDLALAAERYIASTLIDTESGIAWPDFAEDPESIALSLYHGTPGILLFYLELAEVTGEDGYRDLAIAGGDDLLARLEGLEEASANLYSGLAGTAFVLGELARVSGHSRFRDTARATFQRIRDQATPVGSGLAWIEPMPFSEIHGHTGMKEVVDVSRGAAGIGLALLYAAEHELHEDALEWALAVGNRLLV